MITLNEIVRECNLRILTKNTAARNDIENIDLIGLRILSEFHAHVDMAKIERRNLCKRLFMSSFSCELGEHKLMKN